ncbi:hypothetical protein PCE1_004400 [Barthelona sp. PCE]
MKNWTSDSSKLLQFCFIVEICEDNSLNTVFSHPKGNFEFTDHTHVIVPHPELLMTDPTQTQYCVVFTNEHNERLFGFCRFLHIDQRSKRPAVVCLLSAHCWPSFFHQILTVTHLHRLCMIKSGGFSDMVLFLTRLASAPLPTGGSTLRLVSNSATSFSFVRPGPFNYPHGDLEYRSLFESLKPSQLIPLMLHILVERPVLFTGSSLRLLSDSVISMYHLCHPLRWRHLFISILPQSVLHFVCAPVPYIFGVHKSIVHQIEGMPLPENGLIVDIDRGSVRPMSQSQFLPSSSSHTSKLATRLSKLVRKLQKTGQFDVGTFLSHVDTFITGIIGNVTGYIRPIMGKRCTASDVHTKTHYFDMRGYIRDRTRQTAEILKLITKTQCFRLYVLDLLVKYGRGEIRNDGGFFDKLNNKASSFLNKFFTEPVMSPASNVVVSTLTPVRSATSVVAVRTPTLLQSLSNVCRPPLWDQNFEELHDLFMPNVDRVCMVQRREEEQREEKMLFVVREDESYTPSVKDEPEFFSFNDVEEKVPVFFEEDSSAVSESFLEVEVIGTGRPQSAPPTPMDAPSTAFFDRCASANSIPTPQPQGRRRSLSSGNVSLFPPQQKARRPSAIQILDDIF